MSAKNLIESMVKVAERQLRRRITVDERSAIIDAFNASTKSTPYDKAIEAIEKVIGKKINDGTGFIIIEKTASFDNLDVLLANMEVAAEDWKKNQQESDDDE